MIARHIDETVLRVYMVEGCRLGLNSIILFEKSLIFRTMIRFNKIKRLSKFRKNLELFSRYRG
jgi:hypothetical protein